MKGGALLPLAQMQGKLRRVVMHKIMLIGNLGKDPDMIYTDEGIAVTRFSLAVNRPVRSSDGEWQRETDWFNIVAWRQLAETCNTYLRKGMKVYIEGRVQQHKYVGQDGIQRTVVDVVARDMEILTPKSQQQDSSDNDDSFLNSDDLGDLDEHPF